MNEKCRQCGSEMDLVHRQFYQQSFDMALGKWKSEEPKGDGVLQVFRMICWEQQRPVADNFYFLHYQCPDCEIMRVVREKT